MTDIHRCLKESELGEMKGDIRVLEQNAEEATRQRKILTKKCDDIAEINTAISVISLSLEHMIEYDKKQDTMMENQNKTLENINSNLNELNQGQRNLHQEQKNLNNKVAKLEERVDENEGKSIVDIRDIEKEKYVDIMRKYAVPFGVGGTLAVMLMEILKIIKG